MRELALFAGAGGGILGGQLLGWRTVCAVEIDRYARGVLLARQNDGALDPFPIWDDIRTFKPAVWRGAVDVVSGGFPCTDLAACGTHKGITGPSSSLWFEMLRVIAGCAPGWVFIENSPNLRHHLAVVCGGLADLGFACRWGVVGAGAAAIGAPHKRARLWIVARQPDAPIMAADTDASGRQQQRRASSAPPRDPAAECGGWWQAEPAVGRVVDGMAARVDRLRALGGGQVPAVARFAWRALGGE